MSKFQVVSQIRGLKDPKNVKGTLVEHVAEPGETHELDDDVAAPLVAGGALKAVPDPKEEAKRLAAAEAVRRAALTDEERDAEDKAKGAK